MPTPTPTAPPQLDLFADSRDVMLLNDARDTLLQRDATVASAARRALAVEDPQHARLPALDRLVSALQDALPADAAAFGSCAEALRARERLAASLTHDARELLGADAPGWLQPFWRRLAERAAALPFDAAQADGHAASLWLQAGDPAAAARAVEGIPSWRRIPAPLAWLAQARHANAGLDTVWPLLAELAWLAPKRLAECARQLDDPLLTRLLMVFEADFEPEPEATGDALAWFPAWLLTEKPALLPHLRGAEPGLGQAPERGYRLLAELLGLERRGQHGLLVAQRQRLRSLHAGLYAAYMRTR